MSNGHVMSQAVYYNTITHTKIKKKRHCTVQQSTLMHEPLNASLKTTHLSILDHR